MPTVLETAERFRGQLARLETSATNDLITAYRGVTNRLADKLTVLMSKIEVLEANNQLTPEAVRKQAVWSSLLNQLEDEITRFGGYVDAQNRVAANKSIDLAGKHSQQLTSVYFQNNPSLLQAFNATWDRLPNESVETLLGFLQADSQLSINLNQSLGLNAATNFRDKLIEGIALGYNPKKIDSLINQTLSEPLTWSLNTVRTTQNYAYRESTRANYVNNSEILGGWKWYAALDGRVCLSCVNQHGKEFTLEQRLNDHHQGRCTQIPIIKTPEKFGLEPVSIQLGEEWFNNLPRNEQRQRMGEARYNAYLAGKFKFNDLSEVYQNDTFGVMLKEASLKNLLNTKQTPKSIPVVKPIIAEVANKIKEVFKIDSSFSKLAIKELDDTLELINKVHSFDNSIKPTTVKHLTNTNSGVLGSYYPSTRIVEILENQPTLTTTLLHEIGHFIDFEIGNGWSATKTQELKEWRKAVENSKAFKKLADMLFNPDQHEIDYGTVKIKPDIKYTDYLLKYEELFARSYAQYIVTKTGNSELFNETRKDKMYGSQQWDSNDFRPILEAFDKLFEGRKWLNK